MELIIKSDNCDFDQIENLSDEIIEMTEKCSVRYISPYKLRQLYRKLAKFRELVFQMETKVKNVYGFKEQHISMKELLLQIETKLKNKHDFKKAAIVERKAIHYLLERCYWIRYNDSEMVSDLLKMLLEVDGHLGKIFDFQVLTIKSRKRKMNWAAIFETTWSEETLSSEEIPPFVYFLEQTNKAKTLFDCQRLAEKGFVQSIQRHRALILPPASRTFRFPEILIKVLEYGLFANSEPDQNHIGILLTGIIGVILNFSQNSCERHAVYTKHIIKAGNVLLRAVPHVNMCELLKAQKLTVRQKENMTRCIVHEMSIPTLLPQLKFRCIGPQDLQHLCRRAIRHALYDNWKLPQGIALLPLPSQIKDYINLRCD